MAKIMFNTGSLSFDGKTYYVTSLKKSDKYAKVDVTDTGTAGNSKEFIYGRFESGINVEMWAISGSIPACGVSKAMITNFNGITFTGSGSFESVEISAALDNAVKLTAVGTFDGTIVTS